MTPAGWARAAAAARLANKSALPVRAESRPIHALDRGGTCRLPTGGECLEEPAPRARTVVLHELDPLPGAEDDASARDREHESPGSRTARAAGAHGRWATRDLQAQVSRGGPSCRRGGSCGLGGQARRRMCGSLASSPASRSLSSNPAVVCRLWATSSPASTSHSSTKERTASVRSCRHPPPRVCTKIVRWNDVSPSPRVTVTSPAPRGCEAA
jgi:hypothetical protein